MTSPVPQKITVVIPTFNRLSFLRKAVASILEERRVPLQVNIFDNASTDGTQDYVEALSKIDSRVKYVRNGTNIGGEANYVKAFCSIDSEYFVPLADDDYLLPDFLYDSFNIMVSDEHLGAVIFVTEARTETGKLSSTYPQRLDAIRFGRLSPQAHLADWMRYGHYGWSSVLWRRSALRLVGPPYFHVGLPSDVDFQGQVFCKLPVYLVNKPGAVLLLHPQQASRGNGIGVLSSWVALFERLDRAVQDANVLSQFEYMELKNAMSRRYVGEWRDLKGATLTNQELIESSAFALYRLGDIDFAFSLLSRLPPDALSDLITSDQVPAFSLMPEFAGTQRGTREAIWRMFWLKNYSQSLIDSCNQAETAYTTLKNNVFVKLLKRVGLIARRR